MTNSRSNSWLVALVALVGWLVLPQVAEAGRKRVVVLELDGPKAEKFHEDLVKLLKKAHTVVPVDKWNGTAEDLDASGGGEKDIKKVAKKLKIDAIVEGKIQKRREAYILTLRVRDGKSGSLVGNRIDIKAEGPRIDGEATGSVKDELIPTIDSMSAKGGGGSSDDEDEDKPSKKKKTDDAEESEDEDKPAKKFSKKKDDAEESEDEDKPAKKGFSKKKKDDAEESEDEDKPAKKGFSKKRDDEETAESKVGKKKKSDDDEEESPKSKKREAKKDDEESSEDEDKPKKKKVAKKDDEEEGGSEDGESVEAEAGDRLVGAESLTPGERAVDAVLGLSLNARRMKFNYEAALGDFPKPYKGVPVAGALLDATIYPLSFGHKRRDILRGLGFTVMYDKVLKISSKQGTATLPTSEARYAFGAAFRYPISPVFTVGATLRYGHQTFTIGSVGGVSSDLPNVNYSIVDPAVFVKYMVTPKIILNANVGFMALLDTGAIQSNTAYGAATVKGYEGEIGGDYLLTKNIFARAGFKFESISYKFKGTGAMSTMRDTDADQDVFGATDAYYGGEVTVGYLY